MSEDEIYLINRLLGEISELRGEMKGFKEQTIYRLDRVERRCEKRQSAPVTCTTGRALEEHRKDHRQGREGGKSTLMLILEGLVLTAMVLTALLL